MKRILLIAALLTLTGCSNLAMQCTGTYVGEARNAQPAK